MCSGTVEPCTAFYFHCSLQVLNNPCSCSDETGELKKEGSEMERAAPGGRKKTEKQDGNFRFPDVNVMAYYCHCHSVFMFEPLGRFSSTGTLMLQQGLIQALKQPMISGLKTTKGFLSSSRVFLQVFFLPHYSCSLRSVPQFQLS